MKYFRQASKISAETAPTCAAGSASRPGSFSHPPAAAGEQRAFPSTYNEEHP
jgi:hypothetical protein